MTVLYAHRGASGAAPENTMAAFRAAALQQADGIELDVQLSRDGEVVVCHDERVDRTSTGRGLVKDLTLAALKAMDFGSWFAPQYAGETIPTLAEVAAWIAPTPMSLNIEIKNGPILYDGIEEKVAEIIDAFALKERVIVSSFYHPSLIKIAGLCPGVRTGALFAARPVDPLAFAQQTGAAYLHPCRENLDEGWVLQAQERGIGINVWTVNTEEEYALVAPFAVDGLFTNEPALLRKIISRPSE